MGGIVGSEVLRRNRRCEVKIEVRFLLVFLDFVY
jgi:hypothetical protein